MNDMLKRKQFIISPDVSNFLHFSRWLAALVVVLSHVRSMAFPPFDQLTEVNLFLKVFYFSTSLGHEAVMIFFILSGYLIGGEVMREMSDNRFSWKVYLTKRVVRLYIVLIPALVLTAMFDHIGYDFYNQLGNYDRYYFSKRNKRTIREVFSKLDKKLI